MKSRGRTKQDPATRFGFFPPRPPEGERPGNAAELKTNSALPCLLIRLEVDTPQYEDGDIAAILRNEESGSGNQF